MHRQRFGPGLDRHLNVTVGPEPKRGEPAVGPSIRNKYIAGADHLPAGNLVAVAFLLLLVEEGLTVDQADRTALAAADLKLGVGVGFEGLVEQHNGPGVRRDPERRAAAQKGGIDLDALRSSHRGDPLGNLFHEWNGSRDQPPVDVGPQAMGKSLGDQLGLLPARLINLRPLPSPRIGIAIDPVARTDHHELVDCPGGHRLRGISLVSNHLPCSIGVHHLLGRRVALHDQPRAQTHLGPRFQQTEVPDDRGQHISPRLEIGGKVHRFEAPVKKVAAGRPEADWSAIHKEPVAVISRDMDDERSGLGLQIEGLAEMKDPVVGRRRRRMSDPRRWPGPV